MYRRILIFQLLIFSCFLYGCQKEYVSCEQIAVNAIEKNENFPEYYIVDKSTADWENTYEIMYGQYADNVIDFYYVHSSEENRDDEIVIIRFENESETEVIMSAMEERKSIRSKEIKDYLPEDAVNIVEDAIIASENEYVFYLACENSKEIYDYCCSLVLE